MDIRSLCVACFVASVACSGTSDPLRDTRERSGGQGTSSSEAGDGGDTGRAAGSGAVGSSSAGGGGTGGDSGVPLVENLFACGLQLSCPPTCYDQVRGDCGGDLVCVDEVYRSEAPAVLVEQKRTDSQFDMLMILGVFGDGIVQERSRACPRGAKDCDVGALPWTVREQQSCVISELDGNAKRRLSYPSKQDCTEVETPYTCAEVEMLLQAE